jgi:outer membrane protein assembly factor BamB
MRTLACAIGMVLVLGTVVLAQERTQLYTRPVPPPRAALDRLNLTQAWQSYVPVAGKQDGIAAIQVGKTDVFVQTRSGLIAVLDAETGKSKWRARVGLPYSPVMPLTYNSRSVYVIHGTDLYALDRETGVLQWRFRLPGGATSPPQADEEQIYFATADTRLYAYFLPRPEVAGTKAPSSESGPKASDFYQENRLSTGAISAFTTSVRDASRRVVTGPQPTLVWSELTTYRLSHPPIATNEYVLVASPSGKVLAYSKYSRGNLTTTENFEYTMAGGAISPPARFGEEAYVGSAKGAVYAFDIPGGRVLWRHLTGDPIEHPIVALDQDVYVASRSLGLARLNRKTGEPLWRIPSRGRILESNPQAVQFLAANDKFVYALDHAGRLLVLSRRLGNTLSQYDTRGFVFPIANQVTDRLYLAAHNGLILCLRDRAYDTPLRHRVAEEEISNPLKRALAKHVTTRAGAPLPLREVILQLQHNYKLKIFISDRAFKEANREPIQGQLVAFPAVDDRPLAELLHRIFAQVDADFQVVDDTLLIFPVKKK